MKNLERFVGVTLVGSLLNGCYKENSIGLYEAPFPMLRRVERYLEETNLDKDWGNTHIMNKTP